LRWTALLSLSLGAAMLVGQEAQPVQSNQPRKVTNPLLVNITGCLKKNAASGGFSISDQNGQNWELTSKKVDLAGQVFHTVSVTGHPSAKSEAPEGKSEQGQKPGSGNQRLALDVTELEMISPSCTR